MLAQSCSRMILLHQDRISNLQHLHTTQSIFELTKIPILDAKQYRCFNFDFGYGNLNRYYNQHTSKLQIAAFTNRLAFISAIADLYKTFIYSRTISIITEIFIWHCCPYKIFYSIVGKYCYIFHVF